MVKATDFIIGIILVSLVVSVLSIYMGEMNNNYNIGYDNTTFASYQELDAMGDLSQDVEEGSKIKEKSGVLDIIGAYFTDGYRVLTTTKNSITTFNNMSNAAIDDAGLGPSAKYFKSAITAIVLILLVLGVIISAIVKRDL